MAVLSTDIKFYLSGGAANTDPDASLGGARSVNEVGVTLEDLFDRVTSAEAVAGDAEYRCIYIRQENATDTLLAAQFFVETATSSGDTSLAIGLGAAGLNAAEPAIADESTAPAGVTFGTTGAVGNPATGANTVALGDLGPNEFIAVWIRRDVSAAAGSATDAANLRVAGDTV